MVKISFPPDLAIMDKVDAEFGAKFFPVTTCRLLLPVLWVTKEVAQISRPPKAPPLLFMPRFIIRPRPLLDVLILPFVEKAMTGAGPSEVFAGRNDEVAKATADTRAVVRRATLEVAPDEVLEAAAAAEAGIAVTCCPGRSAFSQGSEESILISSVLKYNCANT